MKALDQFQSLLTHLFPQGVSTIQHREMERMFMSGFRVCFETLLNEVTPLPEDEAEERLKTMQTEISDYFALLRKQTNDPVN